MPYAPAWTNGNASGRLLPAEHFIRDDDPGELASAVNRRRRLVYLPGQDFSSQVAAALPVRAATVATQSPPPFRNLRDAITGDILVPVCGGLGGDPATPEAMEWLWPVAGEDQNKVIVPCDPQAGQVGILEQLNGAGQWTDPALIGGTSNVRAVHFNELRQAIEWVVRGRWVLPVYLSAGLFSILPDTSWIGGYVANNGTDELRCVGFAVLRTPDDPPLGLTGLTVRDGTHLELTADAACRVEVYRCLRPIDFVADPPTWNQYAPGAGLSWSLPGGTGAGDSALIGALDLSAGVPGELSGALLVAAVQAMADGQEQNVLLRRADTGYETIGLTGRLTVEFDLNGPPN